MKSIITLSLLLFLYTSSWAQLYIQNGASLISVGNALLTLKNADLINEGTFVQNAGSTTLISGTANTRVAGVGTSVSNFDTLVIAKSGGAALILQDTTMAKTAVMFSEGNIDLNGYNMRLAPNAVLLNESETSRITGSTGGFVEITTTLNAPTTANPGNLGAIISSTQNLGSTTIRRGHTSQVNSTNSGNSILRFFDILPSNNSGLNATLQLKYFDAELNSLSESGLCLWKSKDTIHWKNEGYSSKSAASNFVEKMGIPDFSRWTLSSMSNPLPLALINFSGKCDGGKAQLNWRISSPASVAMFEVQRSEDGAKWEPAEMIAAQEAQSDYQFQDRAGGQYFRINLIGRDGTRQSSNVLQVSCGGAAEDLNLYPNPVASVANVQVATQTASEVELQIFGANGALVLSNTKKLHSGIQEFVLPLAQLAPGIYWLKARWAEGGYQKMVQFVKQ
ncbi:MAG: T9SS type A sorting domain-containing protein [Bacteroidetes bacterium]|nr:T9SS type A sorting domain-containing protein [Bacteroidota bacterium]